MLEIGGGISDRPGSSGVHEVHKVQAFEAMRVEDLHTHDTYIPYYTYSHILLPHPYAF